MTARAPSHRWTRRLLSRWVRDERAVAALEFALVAPLMLTLYLGGYETTQGVSAYRRLATVTEELASVTAQYTTMSHTDVANVMNATSQIMAPYPSANLGVVLSEITTDVNGNATVTWSQPYNGSTPLVVGSSITLPTGMASPSTNYIYVQTAYTYVPVVDFNGVGGISMSDQMFMLPRQSPSIPYTG